MSIIIMILLLSFLILVHEAGHFFAARLMKIKVSKFGFGLPVGPTLYSKKVGDLEILVHACLLGGYVAFPDDDKDSDLPLDSEERFQNKPVWKRMVVISAGVIANVITAYFLVMLTAMCWQKLPSGNYKVFAKEIQAEKEASVWNSGLKSGDEIYSINGSKITSGYAISLFTKYSKPDDGKISKETLENTINRLKALNPTIDGEKPISKNTTIVLVSRIDEPEIKINKEVLKGYALYQDNELVLSEKQTKLKDELKNDESLYVTTDDTTTLTDIAYALSDTQHPINIKVKRDGKINDLKTTYPNKEGKLGILLESKEVLVPTKTFPTIISGTIKYINTQNYALLYGLWQLFTGKIPMKDLHGIVVITKIGGDVINNYGIFSGLLLTAMISLNLAMVNFLPIPALDGGHFMFLLIEKLRGKPVDEKAINNVSNVFFILLIVFMIFIIFNDIYALVKHQL